MIAQRFDLFKFTVALLELFPLQVLGRKGFDHALAQQAVLNRCIQLSDLEPLLAEPLPQFVVEFDRHNAHQRHAGKHDERQRNTGLAQNHKGCYDLDARNKELLGAVVGELGHVKQVVGDAAHDLADFGIIIIGMVQPQQMVKGVATHVGLDMHTHDMPDAGHKVAGRAVDDAQYKVQCRHPQHGIHRQRGGRDRVGQRAHDGRQGNIAQRCQRRAKQIKKQYTLVLNKVGQKPAHQRAVAGLVGLGRHGYLFFFLFSSFALAGNSKTAPQGGLLVSCSTYSNVSDSSVYEVEDASPEESPGFTVELEELESGGGVGVGCSFGNTSSYHSPHPALVHS